MKKSILKKFRHDYEPNCDENNNSTTMDDHYGTFQNGVLLSSTVSNDFKFLDLVKHQPVDFLQKPLKKRNYSNLISVPIGPSYSTDDEDILIIDEDYNDLSEPDEGKGPGDNKRRREDDDQQPTKKQKVDVKVQKSASQPCELLDYLKLSPNTVLHNSQQLLENDGFTTPKPIDDNNVDEIIPIKTICPKFLFGLCTAESNAAGVACTKSHKLATLEEVKHRLNSFPVEVVKSTFTSILPYKRLAEKYFCIFCEFFGKQKLQTQLIEMIRYCGEKNLHSFYAHIVDALVAIGMEYHQALIIILRHHRNNTLKSLLVLSVLITDKRNKRITMFLADLEFFLNTEGFEFNPVMMDILLKWSVKYPKIRNFTRKALKRHQTVDRLNVALLQEFTKLK